MIISEPHKLIFISTPKAGSHTGFQLWMNAFGASPGMVNHDRVLPMQIDRDEYRVITFVRNPYLRFCSIYYFIQNNERMKIQKTIQEFADWITEMKVTNSFIIKEQLVTPQYYWHRNTDIDEFVQLEKLQEWADSNFPELNITVPHEFKLPHPSWEEVKTPELIQAINIWAKEDFEMFNYTKEEI